MKKLLTIAAASVVVLSAAAGAFWYWMGLPLYTPGMVSAGTDLRAPLVPAPQSPEASPWIVEPDIRLHHFAAGSGENVLVVHGGPGKPTAAPWPGLNPLTGTYRFVYYDQRGSGRSTRPIDAFDGANVYAHMKRLDRTLGIGAQLADIERIRVILGGRKLVLIGHSFGGFLASLYAAEFPQHVKALVLVAPADVLVMPQKGKGFFAEIAERLPPSMRGEYADFLKRYLDYGSIFTKREAEVVALNSEFDRYYAAAARAQGAAVPGAGDASADASSAGGWMVHAMYISMGRRHDYRGALKRIAAPVIVIHGSRDLQPEQASRAYVDAIPGAKLALLPGAGHFPFLDQPDAFGSVVGAFLAAPR